MSPIGFGDYVIRPLDEERALVTEWQGMKKGRELVRTWLVDATIAARQVDTDLHSSAWRARLSGDRGKDFDWEPALFLRTPSGTLYINLVSGAARELTVDQAPRRLDEWSSLPPADLKASNACLGSERTLSSEEIAARGKEKQTKVDARRAVVAAKVWKKLPLGLRFTIRTLETVGRTTRAVRQACRSEPANTRMTSR